MKVGKFEKIRLILNEQFHDFQALSLTTSHLQKLKADLSFLKRKRKGKIEGTALQVRFWRTILSSWQRRNDFSKQKWMMKYVIFNVLFIQFK